MTHSHIPDIQSSHDPRNMVIARVGIKDVRFPMMIDLGAGAQATIGQYQLTVKLPADKKGTHMSRFVSLLEEHSEAFSLTRFQTLTVEMLSRLEAQEGDIIVNFPYFVKKTAPVSGIQSMMDYEVTLKGTADQAGARVQLSVLIPMTSLCPCSKEISDYGAHNQRGHVTIKVTPKKKKSGGWELIWIEELITIAEQGASAPIYALLKRPDERHVTMQAYDKPVFVEDLVRNVALALKKDKRITAFEVKAVNQESIHAHDAFARVKSP